MFRARGLWSATLLCATMLAWFAPRLSGVSAILSRAFLWF
jgi:hypothetical protein